MPTFHDAHWLLLDIDGADVVGTFYLYEEPEPGFQKQSWDHDLHVLATLRWQRVQTFEVTLESNALHKLEVVDRGLSVESLVYTPTSSQVGRIVADSVRVESAAWATARFEGPEGADTDFLRIKVGFHGRARG